MENGLRRALRRAREGVALDAVEAEILLSARGDALADLCASAARVRDQGLADAGRPGVITYSKKVFIPLTRLCRDRCHYCTFATTPNRLPAAFLSPDEVLEIAAQGAALGCKEALFTLGDHPEERWPAAREWLDAHGYDSTLAYVRAMKTLFFGRGHPMIGSHDPRMIDVAQSLARRTGRDLNEFEFQLLYGIRPYEAERLRALGHAVRVYVPYGYFMRRLAERPANLAFFVRANASRD